MANDFNFARAPFTNERLPRLLFGLSVFLVASLTIAHGFVLTHYLMREREELDNQVERLRQELKGTETTIAKTKSALDGEQTVLGDERTVFLTRLYRRKSFSWTGLFNELEAITPPSVRITSVAPFEEKGKITVTITLVGRTLQDVLSMVRALESSSFFATVFPVDEANLEELGSNETGIAATLRLQYVEDARREAAAETPPKEAEPEASRVEQEKPR